MALWDSNSPIDANILITLALDDETRDTLVTGPKEVDSGIRTPIPWSRASRKSCWVTSVLVDSCVSLPACCPSLRFVRGKDAREMHAALMRNSRGFRLSPAGW